MTAREKLLERAPHWSEDQAARALRAAEGQGAVDDWGELARVHETATSDAMRSLAGQERTAGHEPW